VVKNYKRFDKSANIDIISKFYHDDELYTAKVELNKHFAYQEVLRCWSSTVGLS